MQPHHLALEGAHCDPLAKTGNCLLGRNLCPQLGRYRRSADDVAGDFDGLDLQSLRVYVQMQLALFAPVIGPVLTALPLAFTQELYPGAVDRQLQGLSAEPIADFDLQRLLVPAYYAVVRHLLVQLREPQLAFHQPWRLPQGQPEQVFDTQVELDYRTREGPLAPTFARRLYPPLNVLGPISSLRPEPSAPPCRTSSSSSVALLLRSSPQSTGGDG